MEGDWNNKTGKDSCVACVIERTEKWHKAVQKDFRIVCERIMSIASDLLSNVYKK